MLLGLRRAARSVCVKSDRHASAGLAGLPVSFAEYTAVGLDNVQVQVEHSAVLALRWSESGERKQESSQVEFRSSS